MQAYCTQDILERYKTINNLSELHRRLILKNKYFGDPRCVAFIHETDSLKDVRTVAEANALVETLALEYRQRKEAISVYPEILPLSDTGYNLLIQSYLEIGSCSGLLTEEDVAVEVIKLKWRRQALDTELRRLNIETSDSIFPDPERSLNQKIPNIK